MLSKLFHLASVGLFVLCSLLSAPAQAQTDTWVAPTWDDANFNENRPFAYVSTADNSSIVLVLDSDGFQWKTSIVVPSKIRDINLVNILHHADGSAFTLDTKSLPLGALQDPHESGGLITTFFLEQSFIDQAKSADSWTVQVGFDRYVFPLTGSRAALDFVETVAAESAHVIEQEKSDMEQAFNNCAIAVAHPHDASMDSALFPGVPWSEIDPEAAVEHCEWARFMLPDNGQVAYHLGRALDKAGDAQAVKELRRSAGLGNSMALFHLGILYRDGDHVSKDQAKAAELFRNGADAGNMLAEHYYAQHLFDHGENPADMETAELLLIQSSAKGYSDSAQMLASWYRDGALGSPNYAKAVHYFEEALEDGNKDAAYALAEMYRDGQGVNIDPAQFLYYLKVAAGLGHELAQEALFYD